MKNIELLYGTHAVAIRALSHAWAGGGHFPSSEKVVKCFSALLMIVECSVEELFMHYIQNIRRLLGALTPDPHRSFVYGPAGDRKPQTPNLPTPGKNHAGAYSVVSVIILFQDFCKLYSISSTSHSLTFSVALKATFCLNITKVT